MTHETPRRGARRTPARGSGKAPGTALLIIDMISAWDFPDADKLLPRALSAGREIAALKRRCVQAGLPVIYANDNRGQWRSDLSSLVSHCKAGGGRVAELTEMLEPGPDDYFVLKPKHSAFFDTPLQLLLGHLGVRRVVLTGVSSDQCVLATALDARMRDLDVVVPADCGHSQTTARHQALLKLCEESFGIRTTRGRHLRLQERARLRANATSTVGDPSGD